MKADMSRIWEGERVAIFASGPSMSVEQADACRGIYRTIAINKQFEIAPWADVFYGSDRKFWVKNLPAVASLSGRKIMIIQGQALEGVEHLQCSASTYDERPQWLSAGGNSGYAAICLAAKLGAKEIHLYGFDMRAVNGKLRRFEYEPEFNSKPRFQHWIRRFDGLATELRARNVRVVNMTRGSALRCFEFSCWETERLQRVPSGVDSPQQRSVFNSSLSGPVDEAL